MLLEHVDAAVGVAPLVVVPGDDLHERALHDRGQQAVDDRRVRVADDVRGDDRVLGVLQDPGEGALGGGGERGVDLLDARRLAGDEREVDDGAGRDRGANGEAVQLAVELGQHEADGLGGTGRRRHEVDRGRARTAQVLVRAVLEVLVGGVGVDRRHQAVLDADRFVDDLRERREAVRRAGGGRDDVVRVGVVLIEVHAGNDGDVLVAGGRGDDDLLRAGVEMLGGILALGEEAGRLEHDVDAEISPAKRGGILLVQDEDRLAVDDEAVVGELDGSRVGAEDRVVAQQVRQRVVVGEVVDRDPLDVGVCGLGGAEDVTADAAEAVDSNTYGHFGVTVLPRGLYANVSADGSSRLSARRPNPIDPALQIPVRRHDARAPSALR